MPSMRESYERKVVPLAQNPAQLAASGVTSKEDSDFVPGSSTGRPTKMQDIVQLRNNQGSFMNVQERNT